MKVKDGVVDSFANILFGKAFAKFLWHTIENPIMFTLHAVLALVGLGFATHDIVTMDNPLWMTLCSLAVFPWGITSLLLLKVQIAKLLLSTFTVWFLLAQATIMCLCMGYIAMRPIVVSTIFPSILASVLIDAFPQQRRHRATMLTYIIMLTWVIAFSTSLIGGLTDIEDPFVFNINELEFSGRAVALASSFNLAVFILHSFYLLIKHPMALTMYTSNLKSLRFDKFELETNERWKKINQNLDAVYVITFVWVTKRDLY